jgi:ribosomal protein S18 acetylase RimI-like enzyme
MQNIGYRRATRADISGMAKIRSLEWETDSFWISRIGGYMSGKHHPQHALMERVIFIGEAYGEIIGFIAGHLSTRFGCQGELEWLNVVPVYRKQGIASRLLHMLADWFIAEKSLKVCIDVAAENIPAQKFYRKHGAINLNQHWLCWPDISSVANRDPGS